MSQETPVNTAAVVDSAPPADLPQAAPAAGSPPADPPKAAPAATSPGYPSAPQISPRIAKLLTPGTYSPPDLPTAECRPCGLCDGVVFLGKGVAAEELQDGTIKVSQVSSLERQALRYLRPMPALWRALHNGQIGVARPHGVEVLFTEAMFKLSEKTGRPLEWMFTCDPQGITAAHPKHREPSEEMILDPKKAIDGREHWRWKIYQVEEGVWALLYV